MKLHYQLLTAQENLPNTLPIVMLHGLFGNLDNLGGLARSINQKHTVLKVDLRNHGLSPHTDLMTYPVMANDLLTLLNELQLDKVIVVGHSMGGKVAMALTALAPQRVARLMVIDIAPVTYTTRRHDNIFAALHAVTQAQLTQRQDAAHLMRQYISDDGVIAFLLKSFSGGAWKFNLSALIKNYDNILGWQDIPAWPHPMLFICGGLSPYVQVKHRLAITQQFPLAKAYIVANAGHWVHAEKPKAVQHALLRFIHDA